MEKKRFWKILGITGIAFLVVIAVLAFFLFKNTTCGNRACFDSALENCKKASYIDDNSENTWQYQIKGNWLCYFKKCDTCIVNAKLLQVKKGTVDVEKLANLDMDCYLPFGYVSNPQDDLTLCHGVLKEQLQEMMINKMHSYILQNLGRMDEQLIG